MLRYSFGRFKTLMRYQIKTNCEERAYTEIPMDKSPVKICRNFTTDLKGIQTSYITGKTFGVFINENPACYREA